MQAKARQTAQEVAKTHNIDYAIALQITQKIYEGAQQALSQMIGLYGMDAWNKLSFEEKSRVCTTLVAKLLDKENVANFIAGRKRNLI